MATKEEDKKPLIVPEAGNAAATDPKNVQDYAKPDPNDAIKNLGKDWGKDVPLKDDTPTINEHQLNNLQHAPDGVSVNDINKVPGKTEPKLNQGTVNSGVLAGAPSNLVIQHMLDAERKPRTPEEQEKLDKKRRRNALFAAIGDGVSALSNLYFTTKGSPSADQSNSLSKAVHDKAKEEDKEYETAMDRRIRLLKEQRAEQFRLEELKIKQQMADAERAYKEAKSSTELKKAEDYMKYLTERNQILQEEKQAAEKRAKEKADQEKKESENRIKNRDSRTASQNAKDKKTGDAAVSNAASNKKKADAYSSGVANQNYNRNRDTTDKINKRKDGNANKSTTKKKTNVTWK